jgi:hypothetical protein
VVLERNKTRLHPPQRPTKARIRKTIEDQITECLKIFLLDRGPLCGLLEAKGENKISSLAGCTLALIQLQHLAEDRDAVQLSRRLADFTLKGQHPRGQFYPYYWKDRQSWLPPESAIVVPLRESVGIALMLLRIAAALQSKGLPASSYLHAAIHLANSLLQANQRLEDISNLIYPDSLLSAGPPGGSPVLVELFLTLHKVTGRDNYSKAVRTLETKIFSRKPQPHLLFGLEGDGADLDELLDQAQAAMLLDKSGYAVKGLHHYFDVLLPRIYLNRPDSSSEFNPVGGANHSLGNPILSFRGFELSHTLLTLDSRLKKSMRLRELDLLISQLLDFTLQRPIGTSYYDPRKKHNERFGPLNSCIGTRELYYMARVLEEFPQVLS